VTDDAAEEAVAEEAEEAVEEVVEETTGEPAEETVEDAAEETAEEPAKEPEKVEEDKQEADLASEVAEKVEVDTIAALEDYFAEKIANVPRDGWAENEIAQEVNDISMDVAGIVAKYFDLNIESVEDVEKLLNTDVSKIAQDPEIVGIGDKMVLTGMDLTALLEKYFTSLAEDAYEDVESGRITQQGVEKILLEAQSDIEGIAQLYIEGVFGQIFDSGLSDEEFNEALAELGAGALKLMDEYGAIDLDSLGLGDIDINDLTDADIEVIVTLDEMDEEVLDGLSSLIGVDVRAVLDSYIEAINASNENVQIENHESEKAYSAPDEEIMTAIEKEEELNEDDDVLPQEVIDVINEAILNGYFEDAVESLEKEVETASEAETETETENAAETETETETATETASETGSEAFTVNIPSVKTTDTTVLLPVSMLRYFK
ncbi:MAG: hypothetical protein J5367_01270, partial [Lachnospiraceae bacterium]|nr:hypothetical protein [Lachnospiraceae bacterium]